ncbi:MAG: P1 family peptidase [Pseudomonadota bacterium]
MADQNLITDLAGIRVGNVHDEKVISGVTAIVFDRSNVASVTIRGGAPGTRDTELLRPEMSAQGVEAVLLTGGSLFGLDAAGGAVNYLQQQGRGIDIGGVNIPIAVQAITFDLINGGDKVWGRNPPYWQMGWEAVEAAKSGDFPLGSVGGGFGTTTATLKGGLGSASATTPTGIKVGAIAVVNSVGTATIGDGPHFWAGAYEQGQEFGGLGFPHQLPSDALSLRMKGGAPPSTTIGLVVTDAALSKAQAQRLAIMADDGLARAVRPAHAPMDGDTVFAVSTLGKPLHNLTEIGSVAADCLARAIARGVYHASIPCPAYTGPPGYHDVHSA